MQRCVYAIPNGSLFNNDTVMKLESDAKESKISPTAFHTKLHVIFLPSACIFNLPVCVDVEFIISAQEIASGLKKEIAKELLDRNVSGFSMKPVKVC